MESLNQPANQLTIAGGTYTPVRGTGLEVNQDESLVCCRFPRVVPNDWLKPQPTLSAAFLRDLGYSDSISALNYSFLELYLLFSISTVTFNSHWMMRVMEWIQNADFCAPDHLHGWCKRPTTVSGFCAKSPTREWSEKYWKIHQTQLAAGQTLKKRRKTFFPCFNSLILSLSFPNYYFF